MAESIAQRHAELFAYMNGAIPQPKAHTTTNTKEDNTMTEFNTERNHIANDLRTSYRDHETDLEHKFHIRPAHVKSKAEAVAMIKAGHFEDHDDEEEMNREYGKYDGNPLYDLVLREHPADTDGFHKAMDKMKDAYRSHDLKVKTHDPKEGFKAAEDFRKATFH